MRIYARNFTSVQPLKGLKMLNSAPKQTLPAETNASNPPRLAPSSLDLAGEREDYSGKFHK